MKKLIFCLVLVVILGGVPARAVIINKLTADTWSGTPTIVTIADPKNKATIGETLADPRIAICQTFKVPLGMTNLKLDKIAIWEDGNTPSQNPYTLRFVDVGTTDPAHQGGGPGTYSVDTDLWGGDVNFPYYGATVRGPTEFDFQGSEEVTLTAGHYYAFEITAPTYVGGIWWYRDNTTDSTYADGAAFVGIYNDRPDIRQQLGSGNGHDFAMAVYLIPEPATIALLSIGGLVLLRKRK
jgi:hypothetical protein